MRVFLFMDSYARLKPLVKALCVFFRLPVFLFFLSEHLQMQVPCFATNIRGKFLDFLFLIGNDSLF